MSYTFIRNMSAVHHAIPSASGVNLLRITCYDIKERTREELEDQGFKRWTTAVSDVDCEECLTRYAINNLKVLAGSRK